MNDKARSNALGALPQDVQPRVRIVTLKLDIMEKRLEELRVILAKLVDCLYLSWRM